MQRVVVWHYDAFSAVPGKGNPAGIVLDAQHLPETAMQMVAERIGFNETTFVLPSEHADLRLRYFTPGHEMNLCGHATVASFFALQERNLLAEDGSRSDLTVETKAGILPIGIQKGEQGEVFVQMAQAPAQFIPFAGDAGSAAAVLGLSQADLAAELPIVYGSTGIWTLIVPVKGLEVMSRMRPRNTAFPGVLVGMPRASIHPICLETIDRAAQMHGRHFSSPFSGTIEDPVTGTASGVMGAYYGKHVRGNSGQPNQYSLLVEQGQEIGRDGRVWVDVVLDQGEYQVKIRGTACFVRELDVMI